MRRYAIEGNLLSQPHRMLISNFKLENGTIYNPLPDFFQSRSKLYSKEIAKSKTQQRKPIIVGFSVH